MDLKIILTPIIGAAIGYSTNWLAIKMLFRPYTEKKMMGIKVPFTPGLIPKERERITHSIGEVIEEYLLTDRVIIDELLADATKEHVLEFVNKYLYNEEGNINLKHIIASEENGLIIQKLEVLLTDKIISFMNEDATKQKMIMLAKDNIIDELKKTQVKEIISKDNTLADIIDLDIINSIKGTLLYNVGGLINSVEDIFQNDSVKQKIVNLIDETIKEKVGALGAMFVNAESIYQTIVEKSKEKLQEDEVKEAIGTFVNKKMDEIINKPLFEILPDNINNELVVPLVSFIPMSMSKMDISQGFDVWEKDIYTLMTNMMDLSIDEKMHKTISDKFENIINDEKTKDNIKKLITSVLDKIISHDIRIDDTSKNQMDTFILKKYTDFISKHITELIKEVKLGKIIEKQLNSFDLNMLEEIILSIAQKELNAITLLGGLLGFIISFFGDSSIA